MTGVVSVAGGLGSGGFASATREDGSVWAWGSDCYGALGTGFGTGFCHHPYAAQVPITGVVQLAHGGHHTLYLKSDGSVWAVGDNDYGQLGRDDVLFGPSYNILSVPNLTGTVIEVAAGGDNSYALTSDGTVWAWGNNFAGQLGNNTADLEEHYYPTQVTGLTDVVDIAAGYMHAYALKSDGTVWAWGYNESGQLGNGTTDESLVPVQVSGLSDVAMLSHGSYNSGYAIKTNGMLWSWGANEAGQLGNGTTQNSTTPVLVANLSGVVRVSQQIWTAVALRNDGTVWTFGDNDFGQLGNGTTADSSVPVKVLQVTDASSVAAAGTMTLAAGVSPTPVGGIPPPEELYGYGNPSAFCNCPSGYWGDPVNTYLGNLTESVTDITIPGRGIPLEFTRTYNSMASGSDGALGRGWSFTYGMKLSEDQPGGDVRISQENGSQVKFSPDGQGGYTALPRVMATLVHNGDNTWTLVRRARQTFTFDASGRLTAIRDLNGYTTAVTYPNSSTTVVTDPAGRTFTFTLNGGAHITSVTDSATPSRTVAFSYTDGNLTEVTNVNGGITQYTYDAQNRLRTIRQPKYYGDTQTNPSPVITNDYDGQGRVVSQTDQVGRTTTWDYTSIPGSTKITDPKGRVIVDAYENGLLVGRTLGYGTSKAALWTYYYDPETLTVAATCDPNNNCDTAAYDDAGNVTSRTDSLGRTTTYEYNDLNDLTSETDPKGLTTTYEYDTQGNLQSESAPLLDSNGQVIATQENSFTYEDAGHPGDVTAVTDPLGKTTQFQFDGFGNLTATIAPPTPENPNGNKTTYGYNTGTGWRTSMVTPKGNVTGGNPALYTTTYTYDNAGRPTVTKDPLWTSSNPTKHQTVNHYDANGNLDSTTDGNGNQTTFVHDPANELTQTTRPDGTTEHRSYWEDGQLKQVLDGRNNPTIYAYDAAGHLSQVTDPTGRITTIVHDGVGNLVSKQDPGGDCAASVGCTTYTYDDSDQMTAISYSDETTPNVTNIAYDGNGRRASMTDGTGTSTWTYDSLGRLTGTKDGANNTVSYAYDLADQLTSITAPGTQTVTRHFDAAGRMDWVQDWRGHKTTFAYDANSNLVTQTLPSGTGVIDTFTYDRADRSLSITIKKGSTTRAAFTYTRDGANQVATSTTTGITEAAQTFGYTQLEELNRSGPTGSPVTHAYDASGNITRRNNTSSLAYDAANQACWMSTSIVSNPTCGTVPSGATTFTYDSRGNRTITTPATGSATTYAYDLANRLKSYAKGTSTATYTYNGDGLRTDKKIGTSPKTHFVWNMAGPTPLMLKEGTMGYVYGPGDRPIAQITSSGTVTYLHEDQLGSVRLLTNNTGANVGTYTYDAYGAVTAKTGTATTPLQFAGQYADSESGLIYMRARYYDPATAQFITRDPIESITRAPYAYVGGNPLNRIDPSGLSWFDPRDWDQDVVGFIEDAGEFVIRNRGNIVTGIAIGTCLVPGWGLATCGYATAGAFGVRAQQRIAEQGFSDSLGANLSDLAFTGIFGSIGGTVQSMASACSGPFSNLIPSLGRFLSTLGSLGPFLGDLGV